MRAPAPRPDAVHLPAPRPRPPADRIAAGVRRHRPRGVGAHLRTQHLTADAIATRIAAADLGGGAILVRGATTPRLLRREQLRTMRPGSVLVDVSIDQGGCFETSHPTTHADPTFVVDGIVHYCVANMPGAVARTSTYALNNAVLPHAIAIANHGWKAALARDHNLLAGLNVWNGEITCAPVAHALGLGYVDPASGQLWSAKAALAHATRARTALLHAQGLTGQASTAPAPPTLPAPCTAPAPAVAPPPILPPLTAQRAAA